MRQSLQEIINPPIFLFQMGKVGSSSLRATLTNHYNGLVTNAHTYEMLNKKEKRVLRWRSVLRLPLYVICPVREPISRNISAFFQNFTRDTGSKVDDRKWTVKELLNLFLEHYPHNVCLEWFHRSLRTTFGIDVFSEPFSTSKKWKTYRHRSIRLLIYRSDLDHSEQLDIISRFIGTNIPQWTYQNMARDKDYSKIYQKFIESVSLPDIYVSIMCNSQFCQHFWSQEEIGKISQRWKRGKKDMLLAELESA